MGVLALVVKAFINMYKQAPKNLFSYILAGVAFVLVAFLGVKVLPVIILCAVSGLIFTVFKDKHGKKDDGAEDKEE